MAIGASKETVKTNDLKKSVHVGAAVIIESNRFLQTEFVCIFMCLR